MKKTAPGILCLLLLVSASVAQSRQITAEARITDVTVFNDRAMIKKTATVKLDKGENAVTFEGLPLQVAEETLRAEAKGVATARITGLSVRNVFLENSGQKRIRDIEGEIQSLERAVQKVDARRAALVAQGAFVNSVKVGWGERISKELSLGKPTALELNEASRFVGESVQKVEEGLLDVQAEKKPLQDKIAALKKQLADISSDRRKEVRAVDLLIDAAAAMDLTVELTYLVSQARWEPQYDIRLSADGKNAELLYRGVVAQSSGEDWKGVNLLLSTATPATGSSPPEIQPWNVSFFDPRPMVRSSAKMKRVAAPAPVPMAMAVGAVQAEVADSEQAVDFLQATHQTSQIVEKQTSVLFAVKKPVDIPADGSRQTSLIATERIPVKAEFVTVPKLSPGVFLKTEVTNMTSYPLLAGAVNVFNDTAFIGKSYLKPVAAGEKFELFFGTDDAVKVKRKMVRVKREAGLLTGNLVSWKCSVELENFRKEEISLTLFDQLPVSGNEELKVAIKDARPETAEIRPGGIAVWKLQLKAGEKREVTFQIDLEYPKGKEVTGLD